MRARSASIPQKDYTGYRSEEDNKVFKEALDQMGSLYASVTGTTVLVLNPTMMPAAPKEFEAVIKFFGGGIFDPLFAPGLSEEDARRRLENVIQNRSDPPFDYNILGFSRVTEKEACVRFLDVEQASQVIGLFKTYQRGSKMYPEDCDWIYNQLAYGNRGWCTFESGAARTVVAILEKGDPRRELQQPCGGRHKMIEIGSFMEYSTTEKFVVKPVSERRGIEEVFNSTKDMLDESKFTGKGDEKAVRLHL